MVNSTGDSVECAAKCIGCFAWRWLGANFGDFNAMRFDKQNSKQLLCEVWINLLVDCPLSAQIQNLSHSLGLHHRSSSLGFDCGNLLANHHAFSEQVDDRRINVVDVLAQLV